MFRYISQQAQCIRSYYSGIGKTAVIYPAAFLIALAYAPIYLGLVFFVKAVFNATPKHIGWLVATWSILYVFGCLIVRPLFNRVLPRYLIVMSTLCSFALTLCMQVAPSLAWIFLLYGLHGLSLSLFWPPLMGWLSADVESAALGRVISRFNLSWGVGITIGPLAAGWLSEMGVRLPLLAGSGFYLLTAAFAAGAASVLPRVRKDQSLEADASVTQTAAGRDTLLRYPAWVGLFACFFGLGVIMAIFPIAALEELSLTKSVIGLLFLVRALTNLLIFVILGKALFWHFRSIPMLAGTLLNAVVFAGLAYAGSVYGIGSLFALLGICSAFSYTTSIFHGASGALNKAQRMAIHEAVLVFGVVAGSITGGMVYQASTITHVYWLCAFVFVGTAVAQAVICVWAKWKGATA